MATITFQCSVCAQVLRVGAENAGKRAKCIKCGTIVAIPASSQIADPPANPPAASPAAPPAPSFPSHSAPPPAPRNDFDFDAQPGPRRSRRDDDFYEDRDHADRDYRDRDYRGGDDRHGDYRDRDERDHAGRQRGQWGDWSKVGIGMTLQAITGGVLAGSAALGVLGTLLLSIAFLLSPPSQGLATAGVIIGAIGAIVFFAVGIPAIIGYVFFLFSPNRRGAMTWAIVVLSVGGLSLIFRIIWILIPAINSFSVFSGRGNPILAVISAINAVSQIPIVLVGGGGRFDEFDGFDRYEEPSVAGTVIVSILILLVIYAEYVLLPIYVGTAGNALGDRQVARGTVVPLVFAAVGIGLKLITIIVALAGGAGVRAEGAAKAVIIIVAILTLLAHAAFIVYGLLLMLLSLKARRAMDQRY